MTAECVAPKLKVLYVPDYISREQIVNVVNQLYRELNEILPGYHIELALAEGPFEDDNGVSAHFEANALGRVQGNKQILALKVDLHVSVIKLARNAALHRPKVIIGKGQGAVVALTYGRPGALEQVFGTRNVQVPELPELNQAWGNVSTIVIQEPRLSRKGVQLNNLQAACPELFSSYPLPSRRTFTWKDMKIPHYLETKKLLELTQVEVVKDFGSIPFPALISEPATLMWEHSGKCPCGNRCYLNGQCPKCLKEEQEALKVEADQQSCEPGPGPAADAVPAVVDEEPSTLELTKTLFDSVDRWITRSASAAGLSSAATSKDRQEDSESRISDGSLFDQVDDGK